MGQQQLLLLVLGIVIVGLAVVVGIQAFGENQKKANADAMVNDGVRIASDIQAWALKPQAFGGPATSGDFSDVTFQQIGYRISGTDYTNLNATYNLGTPRSACVMISGLSASPNDNTVYVKVEGTLPENITTEVNPDTAPTC